MTDAEMRERLTAETAEIQVWLQTPPPDAAPLLAQRLGEANVYLARSAEMLAQAKSILNNAVLRAYESMGDKLVRMGSQMGQKVLAGYCGKEQYLVDWLERVNKAVTHQMESLRSLLSYAKTELRMSQYAENVSSDYGGDTVNNEW